MSPAGRRTTWRYHRTSRRRRSRGQLRGRSGGSSGWTDWTDWTAGTGRRRASGRMRRTAQNAQAAALHAQGAPDRMVAAGAALLKELVTMGQGHLVEGWQPGEDEEDK